MLDIFLVLRNFTMIRTRHMFRFISFISKIENIVFFIEMSFNQNIFIDIDAILITKIWKYIQIMNYLRM